MHEQYGGQHWEGVVCYVIIEAGHTAIHYVLIFLKLAIPQLVRQHLVPHGNLVSYCSAIKTSIHLQNGHSVVRTSGLK